MIFIYLDSKLFIIFLLSFSINFPFQHFISVLGHKNIIVTTEVAALLFPKDQFILQSTYTVQLIGLHFLSSNVNTTWRNL